jgi:ribonuclease E
MAKKMLIDAVHPEETRVVVMTGNRVEDFDFEVQNRKQLRGNIYLAKVTRVEPSLQAAFVEYGGNRHGFLAFSEIHPDYYQIPTADREAIKLEVEAATKAAGAEGEDGGGEDDDDGLEEIRRRILTRRYRIQEVIRRRQVMPIQVVKEERGNKGAALTTYLSLAGRYCVLMPNTARGGGISRKITNGPDRKRLKKIASEVELPGGMGLIIRTAGAKRTKTEIKRDYEYLMRAWEGIRDTTMRSIAPALIYEESSLVKRAIRDLYDKDVDEVLVEGDAAYREAKDFVRMLMPSHAKRVHSWKETAPILTQHGAERQLSSAFSPIVNLRSGGYIVINQTEALVAIDVNSGRATRERNIETTAFKTNLEAAEEAARQIRLRDLAGLIVIDFIDMEEAKNDRAVEKRMKDCLRFDRARVQMGKISPFGLLEISRQRRRTGILEGSSHVCPHCNGAGRIRSVESAALSLLRALDEAAGKNQGLQLEVRAPVEVAFYVLNDKRTWLETLEAARSVKIRVVGASNLSPPDFEISAQGPRLEDDLAEEPPAAQRRSVKPEPAPVLEADFDDEAAEEEEAPLPSGRAKDRDDDSENGRRRRRGRRGGRRGREGEPVAERGGEAPTLEMAAESHERAARLSDSGGRRRRRRRGKGRVGGDFDGGEHFDFLASDPIPVAAAAAPMEEPSEPATEPHELEAAAAPPPRQRRARRQTPSADAPVSATPGTEELLNQPAPEPIPRAAEEPSPAYAEAVQAAEDAPSVAIAPEQIAADAYQPDQAKRDRFFARLRGWGKKDA